MSAALLHKLIVSVFLLLLGLLLWGAVGLELVWRVAGLLVGLRLLVLFMQWRVRPLDERQWREVEADLAAGMLARGDGISIDEVLDSDAFRAEVARLRTNAAPRDRRDIALEALSLVTVVPTGILLGLMLTSEIVSFVGVARWAVALSLLGAVALHFLPSVIDKAAARRRLAVRSIMMVLVWVGALGVLLSSHVYLIKTGPERRLLLADRVWNMGVSIAAGRHADKLFAYAEDLVAQGRVEDALVVYQRGLEVAPHEPKTRQRAIELCAQAGLPADRFVQTGSVEVAVAGGDAGAYRLLWTARENVRGIDWLPTSGPSRFCIVLVPVGEVPDGLLDALAAEVAVRGCHPVYRYPLDIEAPPPDRSHGLIGGRQRDVRSLWTRFVDTGPAGGLLQYVLVTGDDIYMEGANYVFGTTVGLHGVVSYARFHTSGGAAEEDDRLIDRLAKQVLSTSIKGFGLRSSAPGCVTTYCRDLAEFDLKPQVPSPPIREAYLREIARLERGG